MAQAKRDISQEILDGIRELKRGEHGRVTTVLPVAGIRESTGLSQPSHSPDPVRRGQTLLGESGQAFDFSSPRGQTCPYRAAKRRVRESLEPRGAARFAAPGFF